MQLAENDILTFKTPAAVDKRLKAEKKVLSARDYLDLIESAIKVNPDYQKAQEYHMRHFPKVRFEL